MMKLRKCAVLVLFVGASLWAVLSAHAQSDLVSVSPVPSNGTFFSLQTNYPPMPWDPFPSLPLYMEDGVPGTYYYDTTGYGGGWAMEEPPPPGGFGTNEESGGVTNAPLPNLVLIGAQDYAAYTNLYLTITNIGSNTYLTLGSTLSNLTYIVLTNGNLANRNGWGVYTNLVATSNITQLPPIELGTNNLYFNAALVWCTCPNPSALPDWESMLYYGSLCVPESGGYITNGLVAYWRLNDGSGTEAADSSGNGLTLPLAGNPAWTSNYYLNLNGTSQYGDAGSNALTSLDNHDLTICAWININDASPQGIVDKSYYVGSGTPYGGWSFYVYENQLFWALESGGTFSDSGPAGIPIQQWIFVTVAWSHSSNQASFYIDGQLNSSPIDGGASEQASGPAHLEVGNIGTNDPLNGSMRDVAIYNRVLSASEVLTNFLEAASTTNVPLPDLLYYAMTEAGKTSPTPVTLTNSATDEGISAPTNGTMYLPSGGSNKPPEWHGGLGSVSNGLHFNGSYSYLDSNDTNNFGFTTNSFTINLWVRPYGPIAYLLGNNSYRTDGWCMLEGYNNISFVAETTNGEVGIGMVNTLANWPAGPIPYPYNWSMVTVTRDGAKLPAIYIDALPVAVSGTFTNPIASTNSLTFGYGVYYAANSNIIATNYYDGDIWQPQIWSSALGPAQIYLLYTNQVIGTNWPSVTAVTNF